MSDFYDPIGPFNPGSHDCDPFDEIDCYPGIYEPPITIINPPVIIVNDNAAALGSVQTAVNNLTGLTASIVSVLGGVFNLLLALIALFKKLWDEVLKPQWDKLKDAIGKLKKALDKILKPIMDALKKQRDALMDIYNKFIRPLILWIESIRRFIHILQIFHIHLLDKLDTQLAKLEAKIMGPFLAALGRINTLSNWISFILTTRLLIFRGLFLGTMNFNKGGAFTMLAGTPGYGLPLLPQAGAAQAGQPITPDTHQTATAAVKAAAPAIAARYAGTPTQEFVQCWSTPIGNVELAGALDEMFACVLHF